MMRKTCIRKTLPLLLTLLAALAILFALPGTSYAAEGDSIKYDAANAPFELEYQIDGYWHWRKDSRYFEYNIALPAKGDKLTVTKNGVTTVYDYLYVEDQGDWCFVPQGGGTVLTEGKYEGDVLISLEEDHTNWEVGSTHDITITYAGMSTTVPVKIIPNSVESIEYVPVDPDRFTFYEYSQGFPYVDEDDGTKVWRYNWLGLHRGDQLIVNYTDGTKRTVTIAGSDDTNFDDQGNPVYGIHDPGERDGWMEITPGTYDDIFVIKYHEREVYVPITLKAWESVDAAKAGAKKALEDYYNELSEDQSYFLPDTWDKITHEYYEGGLAKIDATETAWDAWAAKYEAADLMGETEYDGGPTEIDLSAATVTVSNATYTGKALSPAVKVVLDGKTLVKGTDYKVSYTNNVKAGKGTATVSAISGSGFCGSKSATFTIAKAAQKLTVTAKTKTLKAKTLKKKALVVKPAALVSVKGSFGTVTYTMKAADAKSKKVLTIKSGKVTVKKKTKKGTYKVKVTVKAAGDANHKVATVTKTAIIKVK